MDYVELIANLDDNFVLHKARLLLLILAFAGENNTGSIEGITKLAKLDFLLRYPTMLYRALEAKGASTKRISIADNEKFSVESEMVRYRFGPWDYRYRLYLNLLVSEGFITIITEGRKINISLSTKGYHFAEKLSNDPSLHLYSERATLLKQHFDITSTNLMNFIYATFPEVVSLNSGKRIKL